MLKVKIWGRYQDKQGRVWKAIEDLKFGRWLLRREDRCVIAELKRADMERFGYVYLGQGASEYVAA